MGEEEKRGEADHAPGGLFIAAGHPRLPEIFSGNH
jgi:hypothetical protein